MAGDITTLDIMIPFNIYFHMNIVNQTEMAWRNTSHCF